MSTVMMILLIIGIPLVLISIGFVILVNKVFGDGDSRAERAQTLEAARQLERTLTALENRIGALEDIVLSSRKTSAFDRESRD